MTPRTATPPTRASALARFGPLTVVLVAIALVAGLASTGRDDDGDGRIRSGGGGDTAAAEGGSAEALIPITWDEAEEAGTTDEQEWEATCDPATGRVEIPSVYAPPCVAARPGVEGGATYQGVTADSIKVVLYENADDDLAASLQSLADPPDVQRETKEALVRMMEATQAMWGRTIEIVHVKGSGSDETSSRADAVKVATEIGAFASIGGPPQEDAYALELANRGVLCIGCGLAIPDSTYQENAPYLWGQAQTPEQYLLNVGDYLIGRLNEKPAEFAGDPALRTKERVFGVVNFEQDPPVFSETSKVVEERGREMGYESKVRLTYQLVLPELAEKARALVARLKEAEVTTVMFLGDPIMPIYLTKAATDQDYFPEWIITGTVLTDTTVFGRQYDQRQWAHAFGLSTTPVNVPQVEGEAWRLHQWFYGAEPVAKKTIRILYDPIRIFMLGVHMAGPNLTPETFRDGMFAYPVSGGSPTSPQISWGDHGFFEAPDYQGVDDMREIWWDAEATGEDEQDNDGTGMMRSALGGKRYLPGSMPDTPPDAFVEEGSVTGAERGDPPPPDYPSPATPGG